MAGSDVDMTLIIDTSEAEHSRLLLISKNFKVEHNFAAENLSENLLIEIKKFLRKHQINFKDIAKIEVATDQRFSRMRTVVATANALIFGLGLKQKLIKPNYSKEPNITKPRSL